jgi:hypothetical protein
VARLLAIVTSSIPSLIAKIKEIFMGNQEFLSDVVATTDEYWVVAKQCFNRVYFETKRTDDSILLISIPQFERGRNFEELTVREVRQIENMPVDTNIPLSDSYSPFQWGYRMKDFYRGFRVRGNCREFLIKALQLDSSDIHEYESLMLELVKAQEADTQGNDLATTDPEATTDVTNPPK